MSIAYFDCFSGASGDMLLSSLIDAGLDLGELETNLARLDVSGYRLSAEATTRHGLSGTQLHVEVDPGQRPARTLPAIEGIIGGSDLPERVKAGSLAIFRRLARVEAAVHGTTIDQVHFHEIGAVDSLVDIVGFVWALGALGIDAVHSSPLTLGGGVIHTEHGRLPAPAPATLALLAEVGAPTVPGPTHMGVQDQVGAPTVPGPAQTELLTPTAAALLTEFATFERPPMAIQAVGYGFGTKEFEWPNALRVWIGESLATAPSADRDEVVLLACNLDDASGELLGYTMERALEAGALDVWFTPIQMKKNRPATLLSVLCQPQDADGLTGLLLRETPTLGVRQQRLWRTKAGRETRQVETPWGPVRVKIKLIDSQAVAASPEYDDCAQLAAQTGVPLAQVMAAARKAAGQPVPRVP